MKMSKPVLLAASVFLFTVTAWGQGQPAVSAGHDTLSLSERTIDIGEVVVSTLRIDRQVRSLPAPITVVRSFDCQKQSALTISNVLDREAGISMGGDGVWATNINIRGLSENRLVTLIDGNRVETATDLTASLSMIDVWDIDHVEVIKGAQSSLYGTGAMGGIVNVITKEGHFADRLYLTGNAATGFASANNMISGHADVSTGAEKWYLRLSGTYTEAGDMRTPEGILPNSQYTYDNFSARIGFRPFTNHTFRLQYQHYLATDAGIPGGDAFPGPAEATYTDISRDLLSASYEITGLTDRLTSLKFIYFNQYIDRNVSLIPNTFTEVTLANGNTQRTTPDLMTPVGKHLTNSGQVQATWKLAANNTLVAGIDAWGRKLTTSRTKYITVDIINTAGEIIKTNKIVRGETPIPESSFASAGLFVQDEAVLADGRLTLTAGGRIDGVRITNEAGYDVDYITVNDVENTTLARRITFTAGTEQSISWSANAGVLFHAGTATDIAVNLARSFRAPSLEERFKYIDLGNYVRLGDPALRPESGFSADLGIRRWSSRLTLQADMFVNHLSDMIVEVPGEFIYTTVTGTDYTTDTIPAFINSNVSKALLYGFDFRFEYNFHSNFVLFGTGSYVRGIEPVTEENLPLIPPLNGRLGLRYRLTGIGSAELSVVAASRQARIAEGEQETAGYTRFDMSVSTIRIPVGKTALQLFAGIDNITDRAYTNHLSTNRGSISVEPGRNFYLRLNFSF